MSVRTSTSPQNLSLRRNNGASVGLQLRKLTLPNRQIFGEDFGALVPLYRLFNTNCIKLAYVSPYAFGDLPVQPSVLYV